MIAVLLNRSSKPALLLVSAGGHDIRKCLTDSGQVGALRKALFIERVPPNLKHLYRQRQLFGDGLIVPPPDEKRRVVPSVIERS